MNIKKIIKSFFKSIIGRFPTISYYVYLIREIIDISQSPKTSPWGFALAGNDVMASGNHEPEETIIIRKLLEKVDIFINVGANVGYYCLHALSMGKFVIAIEPITRNLNYLLKNIKINGWEKQIEVFPVAVGQENGILEMYGGGTGASLIKGWANIPESYKRLVPVLTLDRILGDTIKGRNTLILADIEGAEYMMLKGAKKTLQNIPAPIWFVEVSLSEHQPEGIRINPYFSKTFELFFENSYFAFTASLNPEFITPHIITAVLNGKQILKTHNFIFTKDRDLFNGLFK